MIEINNEEKKFYDKIGKTIGWDFSSLKHKMIDNSGFKYFDEINKEINEKTILLDIGTGGGEKLLKLISSDCLLKIGTDFSKEMVSKAEENLKTKNQNAVFLKMNSEQIMFPNNFFDIICARHTPFNASEVYRTLKNNGLFFSEQIDEEDCIELKNIFDRGQGYNNKIKSIDIMKKEMQSNQFKDICFYEIKQEEYYEGEEDLIFLLNHTPIIPEFGKEEKDYERFSEYVSKNKTEKGIYVERRLFGIKARK